MYHQILGYIKSHWQKIVDLIRLSCKLLALQRVSAISFPQIFSPYSPVIVIRYQINNTLSSILDPEMLVSDPTGFPDPDTNPYDVCNFFELASWMKILH